MPTYRSYVWDSVWDSRKLYATTEQAQAHARRQSDTDLAVLLRDIFDNPYRSVSIDPAWPTWHDGLVVSMSQKMYDSRDFSDMPDERGSLG
jgi:hypothetical protein